MDRIAASHDVEDTWDVEVDHLLVRAAVDAAVCELADVIAGNSWSSFDQELALHHSDVGKPALVYNAPGGRVAMRTDRGLLTVPADCTHPIAAKAIFQQSPAPQAVAVAQPLFHVPVSLCLRSLGEDCGTWGLVVLEGDSPIEAINRFFTHVVPERIRLMIDEAIKTNLVEIIAAELIKRNARLGKHATWAMADAHEQRVPAKWLLSFLESAPMADDDRRQALIAALQVIEHRDTLFEVGGRKTDDSALASYNAERFALPETRAEACAYPDSPLRRAHGGPASNAFASRGAPDPIGKWWPLLRSVKNRHEFPRF